MYGFRISILLIIYLIIQKCASSKVLELSDKFLEIKNEGQQWLVMFYAPWCAHCKRAEPVFNQVGQAVHTSNIRVGRLDCTRFPSVDRCRQLPTILFIKGNQEFIYQGDRTKEDLIDFALRLTGPPVQLITRPESIDMLKAAHNLFFLYIGPQEGILWKIYHSTSEEFQPHGFFYAVSENLINNHFSIDKIPSIIVYKEENHDHYPHANTAHEMDPIIVNETLYDWVNCERFLTFPKITRFNFNHLMQTKKWIVIAVVEEDKLNQITTHELEFRNLIENTIRKYKKRYHKHFQFGWIGDPNIAHSIVMDIMPTPHLIVINSTTHEHHIFEEDPLQSSPHSIHRFLESIYNQSAPVLGGNTYKVRLYRAFFEAKKALIDMWMGNPVLTLVLFGLPLGFLSLILYSIFCGDCLDAPEETEEHEKKE
ncbi:protein disulfide-isomerase TMX3 [Condylostylus longicornis]|uniref:protein disulfide-isomerase TMX3 n=1 Tax=Condylostylus longicornis TaxID=2530218 RepID=UPI00244E3B44|nr:protein disulfide-isomerase TMX3 [Condylostylus longicornis]